MLTLPLCKLVLLAGLFFVSVSGTNGADNDGLDVAEAQIEWLRAKGGFYSPKIAIKPISDTQHAPLGLFAAESFSKGETIAVVPRQCLLTAGPSSEDECDTTENLIKEFKLKDQSDFAPYVSYLFSKDSVPLPSTWSKLGKELIEKIRGRGLPPKDLTSVNYKQVCGGKADPQKEFAFLTVISQGWTDKLVPILDMINHQSGRFANVDSTRVHGPDDITIHATRDIPAGEELLLSYMDCIDEVGNELTYVLPHMLRDFGFVDQYPQRWTFPGERKGERLDVVFDLDFPNEETRRQYISGLLQSPRMNITWRTHAPNDKELRLMKNELYRLLKLDSYVKETVNQLEAVHERDVSLEYYRSLILALRSAVEATMQDGSCSVSGEDDTCASPGSEDPAPSRQRDKDTHWDDLPKEASEAATRQMDSEGKFEEFNWEDLPKEAREAAAALGYEKNSWNHDAWLDILSVSWEHLSEPHLAAAKTLGWDLVSWNGRNEEMRRHEEMSPTGEWLACHDHDRVPYEFAFVEILRSHYQGVDVFYGKQEDDACLFLDGYLHTSASSRPHYHEVFVHYPARFLDQVKRVLYIGGGDSMVLHEVLKYPSLELVVGLELDQSVTRTVFKGLGIQPHWNNEKVEWWYGDAAKSLAMLPREYYGTFDLVIVDILTKVAQSLKVNDELNVIDAAMLLMKPGGIIVKNEDEGYVPGNTSNYTDYSVDLVYHDVPLYCLQIFVVGSNTVDFLTAKPKDHDVETLYLDGVDDFQAQFDSWYNFGTENSRSASACQSQHTGDSTASDENMNWLGVLMVLEAENTMLPLGSAATVKSAITQALNNVGLFETTSMSFPISGNNEGFTLVVLVPEGYIVARCFDVLHYCAFDIQLWGAGIAKLDLVKAELVGAFQSQHPSSYRMITGGMSGVQQTEEKSRLGPPAAEELCNSHTDSDPKTRAETKIRKEKKAEDFERPRASTLHAYNLTSPLEQWQAQRPVGVQSLMQFELPPFVPGESVLIEDDGAWLPGTVIKLEGNGTYNVIFGGKDSAHQRMKGSRIKKVTRKLETASMSEFLAETVQQIAGSETVIRKQVSEETGDGLVIVACWSDGTVIATWDGRSLVEFNLFLSLDDVDLPSGAFNEARRQKLAFWRLARRDDFPRGIGSVVNFKTDMESPPVWANERT